jgi:hypothetical protein
MSALLSGDLRGLDLPRDLAVLRKTAEKAVTQGDSLNSLYAALALEHPLALGELVFGPKALRHESAVLSALTVAEVLENGMQPKALYPRLAKLSPSAAPIVLETAVNRYPGTQWVMKLGERLGLIPGLQHLENQQGHTDFEATCFAHAQNGHYEALFQLAQKGCPEPCAALLSVGAKPEALRAANAALDHSPEAPVVQWLAAVGGLSMDAWLCGLLPQLKSKAAVKSLHLVSTPFHDFHTRLGILLPAVR